MANINDLQYRVDDIGDGNPQNGGSASFFTCVVDPNPLNNVSVPIEDLFIFVRLRAFPQSRSVITTDNKFTSRSQDDDGVYFIGRSRKNSDNGHLTTNYTNIGGVGNTGVEEGLGITNISISVNMFTPSIVEIDFVDVRGAAVFDKQENYVDGDYFNSSRYNSFFTLPYPIFELTVKGYYGKATTYYLNLIDFKATLDGERGDFSIKCKFIGYEFAFLSDIITKYVIDLNNTPVGKRLLSEYERRSDGGKGLMSIPELLQKYTQIAGYVEGFKKEDGDYDLLKIINTLSETVEKLIFLLGSPSTINMNNQYGMQLNDENFNTGFNYKFFRDVGLFSNSLSNNMEVFEVNVTNMINAYNKLISDNAKNYQVLNEYTLTQFSLGSRKDYTEITDELLDDIQTEITNKENQIYRNFYSVDETKTFFTDGSGYFTVSLYDIRENLHNIRNKIKEKKRTNEEQLVERLNQGFIDTIGFNPTVFAVFEIIMGNIDIFLDQVYEVCKKADSYGVERVGSLQDYFRNIGLKGVDVPVEHNRIYPFPAVYNEKGEQVWLGDISGVGENNPYYPEIKLVNDIINNSISDQLSENLSNSAVGYAEIFTSRWIPIHPLDFKENVFDKADSFNYGDSSLTDMGTAFLQRFYTLYNLNNSTVFNYTPTQLRSYAYFEGAYFAANIFNENNKEYLKNIDIDTFVDSMTQLNDGAYYDFVLAGINLKSNKFLDSSKKNLENIINEYYAIKYNDNLHRNIEANFAIESKIIQNTWFDVYQKNNNNIKKDFDTFRNRPLNIFIENIINEKFSKSTDVYDTLSYYFINDTYFLDKLSYVFFRDYSAEFEDPFVKSVLEDKYYRLYRNKDINIPLISLLDDIKIIDGGVDTFADKIVKDNYFLNEHKKIGRSITPEYNPNGILFDQFYYKDETDYRVKTYYFLCSIGFEKKILLNKMNFSASSELYLAFLGGFIAYNDTTLSKSVTSNQDYNKYKLESSKYIRQDGNKYANPILYNIFIDFVEKYKTKYEKIAENYIRLGLKKNRTPDEDRIYIDTTNELLNLFKVYDFGLITGNVNDNKDSGFYTDVTSIEKTKNDLKLYSKFFIEAVKFSLGGDVVPYKQNRGEDGATNNLVVDKNLKIAIYNHLKNIYDKWLSYNTANGKIYNFSRYLPSHPSKNQTTKKRLIDHCYFIDRTWSDIGDKVVLNPNPLLAYAGQLDGNMYFFISRILKDNNFNFYNIPSFVEYSNKEEVSNIFKPYDTVENSRSGSCFVFQYVAGNSKVLDLNQTSYYINDGFDFRKGEDIPKGFLNRVIPNTNRYETLEVNDKSEYLNKFNLCVFRVSYADQNQNIFKEINVTQEEHRETAESMVIQDELAGGKGGTKRIYMGADLYNMYAVRSYRTDVSCLGNTQILPTMYFQLDNVPLFHGAHMITNVKHTITPHNMITEFGGRRISKFVYPIIDKITTYFNLELNQKLDGDLSATENYDVVSNGADFTGNIRDEIIAAGFDPAYVDSLFANGGALSANPTNENSEVFRINRNDGSIIRFILADGINTVNLNQRLSQTLNPNNFSSFGAPLHFCAKWVRFALERIGILCNSGIDAWDFAMGIPEYTGQIQYFSTDQPQFGWTNEKLREANLLDGSILFGYSKGSGAATQSYNSMKQSTNTLRLENLKKNRRVYNNKNYEFSVITHVGIFYNGMFFNLRSKSSPNNVEPSLEGFMPIMAFNFLPRAKAIAAKR